MIEFIADRDPWKAETAGERLLFLLLRNHQEWSHLAATLVHEKLRLAGRYNDLSNFLIGASLLHLIQRAVKLAVSVRTIEGIDRHEQLRILRERLCDVLQLWPLEYADDYGLLVEAILDAAEQASRTISPGVRRRIIREAEPNCYSCGRAFDVTPPGDTVPLERTIDHVWPRALGGDSNFENLLSTCKDCNTTKQHVATWQMAWIQAAVFADEDADEGLKGLRRDVRMALHMRAAMSYAHTNGTTLREAYLTIGPRLDPIRLIDEQGYDFFNLRVHDEEATQVIWRPS